MNKVFINQQNFHFLNLIKRKVNFWQKLRQWSTCYDEKERGEKTRGWTIDRCEIGK